MRQTFNLTACRFCNRIRRPLTPSFRSDDVDLPENGFIPDRLMVRRHHPVTQGGEFGGPRRI